MSEWKETIIGNVAEVKTGPFGSALLNKQYIKGGTPVITVEHIKDFRICQLDYPSVTDEDKRRLGSYTLEEGDIVFSRVGSVDLSAIALRENDGWLFSSRMLRVRPNRKIIDPLFLSYYLRLYGVRKYINNIAVGSTMPSINTEILKSIPIIHCELEEQKEIAKTLSNLDQKITLLRQQNRDLEELAQTLFKRWFVEFEFPNKNGEPYKSSGGKMIASETGEIPEGWRFGELSELLEIKYGKDHKHLADGNIPVYGSGGIMRYVNEFIYDKPSILLPRKGTLSNLFYLNEPFWSVDTMFYSKIKKEEYGKYCFQLLKTLNLSLMDVGSAVPSLSTSVLNGINVLIPYMKVAGMFEEALSSLFNKKNTNQQEIQTLTQLRDALLPKLMSGELRIKVL